MEITKSVSVDNYNFPVCLIPLFNALKAGKTISVIELNDDIANKRGYKFIRDFKATVYYVGACSNYECSEEYDLVTGISTSTLSDFCMNWVINFEIN